MFEHKAEYVCNFSSYFFLKDFFFKLKFYGFIFYMVLALSVSHDGFGKCARVRKPGFILIYDVQLLIC